MPLEQDFYKGNYQRVLSATVDSQSGRIPLDSVAFVIGALTFRGRLDEALTLFDLFHKQIDEETLFISRFYLGINLSRHSRHAEGRKFLAINLSRGARHISPRIRFFAWQGAGFYRLVSCRYQNCLRYASRALSAALEGNFLYGKVLASDLLAHSQVGPGLIRAADENFRRALSYAELLGDGGISQALRVSISVHSAVHGFDPHHDIQNLEEIAANLTLEDNYSKSRILLELGRQHMLRGSLIKAKKCLDDACRLVYVSQNTRHGILLNMRYAYIMYNEGESLQALKLLRNAAKNIDTAVDLHTAVELQGLECRILEAVSDPSLEKERVEARARLNKLTAATGRSVCQRILNRKDFRSYNAQLMMGDDPLGDLVDNSYSRSEIANKKILDSGYLYLLYQKLNWQPGTAGIHIDLVPGSLIAYENGAIHLAATGVSNVIRLLLQQLVKGQGSKEELIRSIWHYHYSPIKHDQLIYTAISRLRQLLGPYSFWIEVTETGYALRQDVRIELPTEALTVVESQNPAAKAITKIARNAPPESQPNERRSELNQRQLAILEQLQTEESVDSRIYMKRFKISEASARRDLSSLLQMRLISRQGRGQATCYILSQTPNNVIN